MDSTLGVRIKNLRTARGLTQDALAEKSDVSRVTIARIESENVKTYPTGDVIIKLADFFGVSTDYLLGRTEDPANNIICSEINGVPVISKTVDGKPLSKKDRELANAAELRAMDQPEIELDERVRRLVDARVRELLNRVIPERVDEE